ncbi:MAG: single-stranded-DNA-specific exonuclease RecJ [Clostridia bacterium]
MKIFECSVKDDEINVDVETLKSLGFSEIMIKLLIARGIKTGNEAKSFLYPEASDILDPFTLPDMAIAVERIRVAAESAEKICIFGDYDTDGICATAMLLQFFKYEGLDCFYYIPSRHDDGYGMSKASIKKISELGAKLIITVDNGVTANIEIEYAKSLGLDVIVTDHHRCFGKIPDCSAVVCHTRVDSEYKNPNLCGAGVALKIIGAIGGMIAMNRYLPYAALATVADVVPLFGENRAIVDIGILSIRQGETPIGISALLKVAGVDETKLTARDLAFMVSPRLNAAGRIANASLGVELMISQDTEYAVSLAQRLNELNNERKGIESVIVNEACGRIEATGVANSAIIVEASESWNAGIIGIAASRLVEKYYRPVILFSENDGVLTGSARSIPGVDIQKLLSVFSKSFMRFGGHELAAGLTIRRENYETFARDINDYLYETGDKNAFIPRAFFEAEYGLSDMSEEIVNEIEKLAPFGEGNQQPVFCAKNVRLTSLKRVGVDGAHLKMQAVSSDNRFFDAIAFSKGADFDGIIDIETADILYAPSINVFNGRRALSIKISEINAAIPADAKGYTEKKSDKFFESYRHNLRFLQSYNEPPKFKTSEFDALAFDGFSSSAILCFTKLGAENLIDRLRSKPIPCDICFFSPHVGGNIMNAAILAPKLNADWLSRFKRIVVYDFPYSTGILEAISELSGSREIIFIKNNFSPDYDVIESFLLNRDEMKAHYRALVNRSKTPEFLNATAEFTSMLLNVPIYIAEFAIDVFLELEFFILDKNRRLILNPLGKNRELIESRIYKNAISAEITVTNEKNKLGYQ